MSMLLADDLPNTDTPPLPSCPLERYVLTAGRTCAPGRTVTVIHEVAAQHVAQDIADWLSDGTLAEEVVDDLVKLCPTAFTKNGAALAAELESRMGYETDDRLVSLLNRFQEELHTTHRKLVDVWARHHQQG